MFTVDSVCRYIMRKVVIIVNNKEDDLKCALGLEQSEREEWNSKSYLCFDCLECSRGPIMSWLLL